MTVAVHNALQLDDPEVRDRFVVRGHELEELLAHLREPDPPRHALVIGQRGMGKSLLLRRVAVTVADEPDLAARWLPVLMPEELYEVTSVGDLWLAALARLAAAESDADLAAQHAALLSEPDAGRLATRRWSACWARPGRVAARCCSWPRTSACSSTTRSRPRTGGRCGRHCRPSPTCC